MASVTETHIFCNKNCKIDFEGGNLSSDSGILLVGEFMRSIGLFDFMERTFRNDAHPLKRHSVGSIIAQKILQLVAGYDADRHAKFLADDPSFQHALGKECIASQPTMSRNLRDMDALSEDGLNKVLRYLRRKAYAILPPKEVILDIDTTILQTYGKQEGAEYIHHYGEVGYHPHLCYDGNTGDMLRVDLRKGASYCGKGADTFLKPLLDEYTLYYPRIAPILRGDSGFAMPELYTLVEHYPKARYVIRLKENAVLDANVEDALAKAKQMHDEKPSQCCEMLGEFQYCAGSWERERRIVYKVDWPVGELFPRVMFLVTNMDKTPKETVEFYCKRGNMENFIKESKNSFGFAHMSSAEMNVNRVRLVVSAIAYAVFNLFRRLCLPAEWKMLRADGVRLCLLKVASRVASHARELTFHLCSSYPFRDRFLIVHRNIMQLIT